MFLGKFFYLLIEGIYVSFSIAAVFCCLISVNYEFNTKNLLQFVINRW
jgi:hypothetical protein